MVRPALLAAAAMAVGGSALEFTVFNGQIFTPGFAIVDAPQPGTPEGGDFLQVALDISADGKLPQPPYDPSSPSQIWNITMFLSSYATGRNFTISNGTATANNGSLGEIMAQEPGSTVKHVNWVWPDCLVGDGQPSTPNSDRGVYNISIRQNFRLNGKDHYTIFDLPISVTNSIPDQFGRVPCDSINNPLLTPEQINATAANDVGILFAPGDNTTVEVSPNGSDGLGGNKPGATPSTGLGGAGMVSWKTAAYWLTFVAIAVSVLA